jgi:hypothetical protein
MICLINRFIRLNTNALKDTNYNEGTGGFDKPVYSIT